MAIQNGSSEVGAKAQLEDIKLASEAEEPKTPKSVACFSGSWGALALRPGEERK